jgi:hypothetical protein
MKRTPSIPPDTQFQGKWDYVLLAVFGLAFLARLFERLNYVLQLAWRPLDFTTNFGVTEWLINYAGGFQRRGLPGSIVHGLYEKLGIIPNTSIIGASIFFYLVFFLYLWRQSTGIVPRWVLLTTPLLGYAVFIDRILIRKDFLILVIFAFALKLICTNRGKVHDLLAALLLGIGVLSYELIAFLGLPAVALLILLRTHVSSRKGDADLFDLIRASFTSLLWLLIPLSSFISVLVFRGTKSRADAIALSWKSAYNPEVPFIGPQGSLAWLSIPSDRYIADSQRMLATTHYGVPFWCILALASLSGAILLAGVIGRCSQKRAWFFLAAVLIQFTCMAPLFYHSWDHGRWVVLSLLTAFVIAMETPLAWQEHFALHSGFPRSLEGFCLPGWVAPLGLAFWGMEIVSWSPQGWLQTAPVGLFLQIYFYLRVLGMSKPI